MKIFILQLLFAFTSISVLAQYDGIEVPIVETVQTFIEVNQLIPIYFKEDGENKLSFKLSGDKYRPIYELTDSLFKSYYEIGNGDFFRYMSLRPELIIPNDFQMNKVEQILIQLQRNELLRVIFSLKTESFSRIPSIWSTGFYHILDTLNIQLIKGAEVKTTNLQWDVSDKISNEQLAKLKAQGKSINPPPPPPPPPAEPKLEDVNFRNKYPFKYTESFSLLKNEIQINSIKILKNGKVNLNSEELDLTSFEEKLSEIDLNRKTFYILEYDETSKYEDYINSLILINDNIFNKRIQYCKENYLGEYHKLKYDERRVIDFKIPYNLIEKRLLYN